MRGGLTWYFHKILGYAVITAILTVVVAFLAGCFVGIALLVILNLSKQCMSLIG